MLVHLVTWAISGLVSVTLQDYLSVMNHVLIIIIIIIIADLYITFRSKDTDIQLDV